MTVRIEIGDSLEVLRAMPSHSVHMVICSPPYWGLRDYGGPSVIRGGDPGCAHEWGCSVVKGRTNHHGKARWNHAQNGRGETQPEHKQVGEPIDISAGAYCTRCGAWRGQIGLEPSIEQFIANMVELFREVRRVLRPDGTCWVNMGDSYVTSPNGRSAADYKAAGSDDRSFVDKPKMDHGSLKPKQRLMQPARLALALQDDGWWLRDEIVWHKPNPMPSSVKDKTTPAHEFIHVFSPSPRYFYDFLAIHEPVSGNTHAGRKDGQTIRPLDGNGKFDNRPGTLVKTYIPATRNKRSVWAIKTQAFPEAHFATFPEALVEPCILAGTSAKGVCPDCGAPWVRIVEKMETVLCSGSGAAGNVPDGKWKEMPHVREGHDVRQGPVTRYVTKGFKPSCTCPAHDPIPATVLDPFGGSGTTGLVSERLGRDSVLIEIKQDYADIARDRIRRNLGRVDAPHIDPSCELPLFSMEAAE